LFTTTEHKIDFENLLKTESILPQQHHKMPINTALLTPQFFLDRMRKPTKLDFSFPCPFLWENILEQKQIAEQRDLKTQLLKEIPGYVESPHKLGLVPQLNRLLAVEDLWEDILKQPGWQDGDVAHYRFLMKHINAQLFKDYGFEAIQMCSIFERGEDLGIAPNTTGEARLDEAEKTLEADCETERFYQKK
jgi:hypothetical protein